MATDTYGYSKLADSQFQSGVEITPNKGAGGSTYTGTVVFYAPAYGMNISAVYPIINTIKVGGGNLFEEEAKFEFEFGTYDSSGFHPISGWTGSFTVSEGTVSNKQCTIDGGTVHIKPTDVMAYRLKVSSNKSSRVANTTMTGFRLKFDYEFVDYTVTVNVSPEGAGTVNGAGILSEGWEARVEAVPNSGYKFVGFGNQNGVVTVTTNPYVFTVNNNTTFYAIFELDKINQLYNGDTLIKGMYTDGKTIVFVVDGTVTPATSIFDTVDGYHIKVQNTVPSEMVEAQGYIGTTKVYG